MPIPGTKRRRYLEENVAALQIELSADDLRRLDEAFPAGAAAGDRYPNMSTVNRYDRRNPATKDQLAEGPEWWENPVLTRGAQCARTTDPRRER